MNATKLSVLALAAAVAFPTVARAQYWIPTNVTDPEVKLGILDHDVHFLVGWENGVDINPELRLGSPVSDQWTDSIPAYLRWIVQPRPTVGLLINTSGYTSQVYLGPSWTWRFASNVLRQGDGITGGIFFGAAFNNGEIEAHGYHIRKSLGGATLFHVAGELGYEITPTYNVSAYLNHSSNGGFDRFNEAINDLGLRFGVKF